MQRSPTTCADTQAAWGHVEEDYLLELIQAFDIVEHVVSAAVGELATTGRLANSDGEAPAHSAEGEPADGEPAPTWDAERVASALLRCVSILAAYPTDGDLLEGLEAV